MITGRGNCDGKKRWSGGNETTAENKEKGKKGGWERRSMEEGNDKIEKKRL